jgi:hypothetical protein
MKVTTGGISRGLFLKKLSIKEAFLAKKGHLGSFVRLMTVQCGPLPVNSPTYTMLCEVNPDEPIPRAKRQKCE